MKKYIPNILTGARIVGTIGLFLYFWVPFQKVVLANQELTVWVPFQSPANQELVVVVFILLALSDILDGYLARRWHCITKLGKIIDPLADKLLVLIYLPLLAMRQIEPFPVFVLISRDLAVTSLRALASHDGVVMTAQWSGKIRTCISLPLAGILLCRVQLPLQHPGHHLYLHGFGIGYLIELIQTIVSPAVVGSITWLLVSVTVVSFIQYTYSFYRQANWRMLLLEN